MTAYSTGQTRKYEVVWSPDGWVIERGGEFIACFTAVEAAVAHACRAAQEDARRGWLGIVTTQTTPRSSTALRRPRAPVRPYPGLVSSR